MIRDVGAGPCIGGDSVWSFPIGSQLPFSGVLVAHVRPMEEKVSRVENSGSLSCCIGWPWPI